MKITVLGGDSRLITVKSRLENEGYSVDSLGLFENDRGDFKTSNILVLPVPTTRDGINIFTPLTGRLLPLSKIEAAVSENTLLLCCNYEFKRGKSLDYNRMDSYALLNAIPTAEGAIKLAIENTPFTLWQAKTLVIGYGRVGKILASRLKGMGCRVTVSARKPADFALIAAENMEKAHTSALSSSLLDYDIIFNTVDFPVLSEEAVKNTPCKCIIDLSSKGGFDLNLALDRGITAIKAPSLPVSIAPKTAGEFLAQTIVELISTFK